MKLAQYRIKISLSDLQEMLNQEEVNATLDILYKLCPTIGRNERDRTVSLTVSANNVEVEEVQEKKLYRQYPYRMTNPILG